MQENRVKSGGCFYHNLPFYLRIAFEYEAITTKQDWVAIREALKKWILEDAPRLSVPKLYTPYPVSGIPFNIYVTKDINPSDCVRFSRLNIPAYKKIEIDFPTKLRYNKDSRLQ